MHVLLCLLFAARSRVVSWATLLFISATGVAPFVDSKVLYFGVQIFWGTVSGARRVKQVLLRASMGLPPSPSQPDEKEEKKEKQADDPVLQEPTFPRANFQDEKEEKNGKKEES